VDLPPGTGDVALSLIQTVPLTGAIVVSTPSDVSLQDARKAIEMFRQMKVDIVGVVENMSYFVAEELPANKYYIFGKEGGRRLAEEYDIPFLGEIPLVQNIREGGDTGIPVMMSDDEFSKKAFEEFSGLAVRSIAMLNANITTEKVAETVM